MRPRRGSSLRCRRRRRPAAPYPASYFTARREERRRGTIDGGEGAARREATAVGGPFFAYEGLFPCPTRISSRNPDSQTPAPLEAAGWSGRSAFVPRLGETVTVPNFCSLEKVPDLRARTTTRTAASSFVTEAVGVKTQCRLRLCRPILLSLAVSKRCSMHVIQPREGGRLLREIRIGKKKGKKRRSPIFQGLRRSPQGYIKGERRRMSSFSDGGEGAQKTGGIFLSFICHESLRPARG
jgi:hypothetical protein